ncbi:tyrosine-type recombinase/integrase [bacterium]|nr:tyrosine-type recombinase/integrase [bacterium]
MSKDGSTCVGIKLEGPAHSEAGYEIRTVQELLGHSDVRTTMIYTHVPNQGVRGVRSPADFDSLDSD